jgi:hypothetical protein
MIAHQGLAVWRIISARPAWRFIVLTRSDVRFWCCGRPFHRQVSHGCTDARFRGHFCGIGTSCTFIASATDV